MGARTTLGAAAVGLVVLVLSAMLAPSLAVIAAVGVCVLMMLVGRRDGVPR